MQAGKGEKEKKKARKKRNEGVLTTCLQNTFKKTKKIGNKRILQQKLNYHC